MQVQPGVLYGLDATIELESEDGAGMLQSFFRVYRKTPDGHSVNMLRESQGRDNIVIGVDNTNAFSPKAGATFLLNPKVRNNTEQNAASVINARTGNVVESSFENFGWIGDGWITSEYDGQKILRVPSGARVVIRYNPFRQFRLTPDSAMTMEIDFAMRKITNETDPIFTIMKTLGSSFRGLRLTPLGGNLYTKSNTLETETDFHWQEDVRVHLTVNIHNAVAPNKGDVHVPDSFDTSKTKLALVRIYINGDKEREFEYSPADSEEFTSGTLDNDGITIGTDGADIDLYSLRIYENTVVEENDVLNNYIASLPTTAGKLAARKRNDLLTGGRIDIEKVKQHGKNCLVWHGVEPYHESPGVQKGWWEIFRYDESGNYLPEYSGTLCKETASLEFKDRKSVV